MAEITVIQPTGQPGRRLRCGAYCRVSTDSEEQLRSFEVQRLRFLSLAEQAELVEVYTDIGSGTTADRPGFMRMLADCRAGRIDRIVTKSVSRFARNTHDCLAVLRELSALGVSVCFEKENIDTARTADEMMIAVMGGLAQEESRSISNNIRWSLRRKMASGTLGVARVPYGFDKVNGSLAVNEEQAAVVRRIFSLYYGGIGARRIAALLNSDALPSPTGRYWSNGTIYKMLSQEKYLGDILWQKTTSEFMGGTHRNSGQADCFYVSNAHEPIISADSFDKTKSIRAANLRPAKTVNNSPFRRRIICGLCGRSYYLIGASRPYWQCSGRFDLARPCSNSLLYDDDLNRLWRQQCVRLRRAGDIFSSLLEALRQIDSMTDNETNARLNEIKAERTALRRKTAEGCLSYGELLSAETALDSESCALTDKLSKQSGRLSQLIDEIKQTSQSCDISRLKSVQLYYDKAEFELIGGLVLKCLLPKAEKRFRSAKSSEPAAAISRYALCGKCGQRFSRKKQNGKYLWRCENAECAWHKLHLTDDEILSRVGSVIGRVCANPRLIKAQFADAEYHPSEAVTQAEQRLEQLISSGESDKETLTELALGIAEQKLNCISYCEKNDQTEQITTVISEHNSDADLMQKAVRHIYITPERVRVKFINGKTVRSERSACNEQN